MFLMPCLFVFGFKSIFVLIVLPYLCRGLHIALHAQVGPSSGFIVGSVITTSGLRKSFLKLEEVDTAKVFYPFEYEGLHATQWDVFLIEGWFHSINAVIHEVRIISPHVKVLFYCLDPDYPGMEVVSSLDVDGYMTNSQVTLASLSKVAPTELVLLAADTEHMKPPPHPPDILESLALTRQRRVVYVGAAGAIEFKQLLPQFLREAAWFGLEIWGSGWDSYEEFRPYWKGILPEDGLAELYGTSAVVIGVTMDAQREEGMANNRVFEALACGAALLTDWFPALEELLGPETEQGPVMYAVKAGDVTRKLQRFMRLSTEELNSVSERARSLIQTRHTWDHRVSQVMRFYRQLLTPTGALKKEDCPRPNCLQLGLVIEPRLKTDALFITSFSAAVHRLWHVYSIQDIGLHDLSTGWSGFDIIWAVGRWNSPVERAVRGLPERRTPRGLNMLKGWVMWEEDYPPEESIRAYDVVYYKVEWDRMQMSPNSQPFFQHAFGVDIPERKAGSMMKRYSAISVGSFDNRARHQLVVGGNAESPDKYAVALTSYPDQASEAAVSLSGEVDLLWFGAPMNEVTGPTAPGLFEALRASGKVVIGSCLGGGGEWAFVAAVLLGIPIEIQPDNPRMMDLALYTPAWNIDYYSQSLIGGVTRSLCLGTSRSSIEIVAPRNNTVVTGQYIPVQILLTDFDIPRDGQYCLFGNGYLIICLRQERLQLILNFTANTIDEVTNFGGSEFILHADLKSNIYSDVITESSEIRIISTAVENNYDIIKQVYDHRHEDLIFHTIDVQKFLPRKLSYLQEQNMLQKINKMNENSLKDVDSEGGTMKEIQIEAL